MSGAAPSGPPTGSAQTFVVTFALIAAAIGALFVADTFLAQLARSADRATAAGRYREGVELMKQGNAPAAIEQFREAVATQRDDRQYQLALANAALSADRPADAAAAVAPTLSRDATDGAANLAMARALLAQGQLVKAIAYYHRGIYGRWPPPVAAQRTAVRVELIDLLARRGAREDLLAELLLLENDAAADSGLRRRVAHLFVAAGSPNRAIPLFREILRRSPADADALGGLGEAEFARGDYRRAEGDLVLATRQAPSDGSLARKLKQVRDVRSLDPLVRGLGPAERNRRSRDMLSLVIDAVEKCPAVGSAAPVRAALDSARIELSRSADARLLDRADQLWTVMPESCRRAPDGTETALGLVLDRLSQ